MKKTTLLCFAAASMLTLSAVPAAAQTWMTINQRQANLDQRIDTGVRNGSLTRQEAVSLRAEFRTLGALETRYRATGGFTSWERQDLDRRFDALSARIRIERRDAQDRDGRRDDRGQGRWTDNRGQWIAINQRMANLDRRIDQGVRNRTLTRQEAVRLRAEYQTIARLETTYRRGGLSSWERNDLDRRFDALSARIRDERRDRDYGYNR